MSMVSPYIVVIYHKSLHCDRFIIVVVGGGGGGGGALTNSCVCQYGTGILVVVVVTERSGFCVSCFFLRSILVTCSSRD